MVLATTQPHGLRGWLAEVGELVSFESTASDQEAEVITDDPEDNLRELRRLYRWESSRVRSRRRAGQHALAAHSRRVAAKYWRMAWDLSK